MIRVCHTPRQPFKNRLLRHLRGWATPLLTKNTLQVKQRFLIRQNKTVAHFQGNRPFQATNIQKLTIKRITYLLPFGSFQLPRMCARDSHRGNTGQRTDIPHLSHLIYPLTARVVGAPQMTISLWTSLPMPELLTMASRREDWKRISVESSLMSSPLLPRQPHPKRTNRPRD